MNNFTYSPSENAQQAIKKEEPKQTLRECFATSLSTASEIIREPIPPRKDIVKPFMKEADLGFIYAPRGLGKTWMAIGLAKTIATGQPLGDWQGGEIKKVLMIDGEMNLDATQERLNLLGADSENIQLLHHEKLFSASQGALSLNLADKEQQLEVIELIKKENIGAVFIDNLSCLFRGVNENEADAWEQVLPWLLDLRRLQVTVIIVAHAGRNGNMRGTSKREDSAHWTLSLEPCDDTDDFEGARFKSRFTKGRNVTPDKCPPLVWEFRTGESGLSVSSKSMTDKDQLLELIANGIDTCKDLCQELNKPKGTISKWATSLEKQGKIYKEGGKYKPALIPTK